MQNDIWRLVSVSLLLLNFAPFSFHVPKPIVTVILLQASTQFYLTWLTGTLNFV